MIRFLTIGRNDSADKTMTTVWPSCWGGMNRIIKLLLHC